MINQTTIKLYSKDKESLKQFKNFLENINKKWKNFTFNVKNNKKKRKKITVLKSPHVNKKAQTQFQSIIYSANIKYFSLETKKNYIILKKIKNHLFPDIKIQIEQNISGKKLQFNKNKLFLPKTLYYFQETKTFFNKRNQKKSLLTINKQTKKKKVLLSKTLQFLKVLDNYGNYYKI